MSSKTVQLYLAHPIGERHWIREWELLMEKKYPGLQLCNPFYDVDRDDIHRIDAGEIPPADDSLNYQDIVMRDLQAIDNSIGIVAFVTKSISIGTIMEIFYNRHNRTMPAFICVTRDDYTKTHPWLKYGAQFGKILYNLEDLETAISEYHDNRSK